MIATYVINTYNHQARLLISGSDKIISGEGTAKDNPAPGHKRIRFKAHIRFCVDSKQKRRSVCRLPKLCG